MPILVTKSQHWLSKSTIINLTINRSFIYSSLSKLPSLRVPLALCLSVSRLIRDVNHWGESSVMASPCSQQSPKVKTLLTKNTQYDANLDFMAAREDEWAFKKEESCGQCLISFLTADKSPDLSTSNIIVSDQTVYSINSKCDSV